TARPRTPAPAVPTGRARFLAVAFVLVALVAQAACSRPVEGTPVAVPGAAPAPSAPPSLPPATTGDPAPAAGPQPPADVLDALRAALIQPGDLGPGWTVGDEPVPDPSTPAACGGPGVVAQFPDAVRLGTALAGPQPDVLAQETVSIYADPDTARAAFLANAEGLACSEGTLGDRPVVITPAEDLTFDLGGEQALGWQAGTEDLDLLILSVQAQEAVVTFTYVAPTGFDWSVVPDRLGLSRTAVGRLLAA
ncbi:MAG TPA: hypothetical protein VD813_03795, partial [Pseudonocardia sp.]|nr:hypothetical protein [Pseudonocardia sp.]